MKKLTRILLLIFSCFTLCLSPAAADDGPYAHFFLPEKDGFTQAYVGDCMPYYEDGVYYIYYLKEGGNSFRHSIFLTTTTDFVTFTDYKDPILVSSEEDGAQDAWIGTGSVVKIDDSYYLFYTGHTDSDETGFHETVMAAKGDNLTSFEKVSDWEIIPDVSLGQNRDFRDPQGYYDEESGNIIFTITAAQDGIARILKYTVSKDLTEVTYDGIIFTDPVGKVYNLECSDTFRIGDKYYLTYSAQDDTLWYAVSDTPYGPYSEPVRMDGLLFYAAKHVEDGDAYYMAGWGRRSQSETSTTSVSEWAGNLIVQKIHQLEDGSLKLAPVDALLNEYTSVQDLAIEGAEVRIEASDEKRYEEIVRTPESFVLQGNFKYDGDGAFGLAFEFKEDEKDYKLITVDPTAQKLILSFKGGKREITEIPVSLTAGETYSFTYIQEQSVGVFYIDDIAALTVRMYRVADKPLRIFAEQNTIYFSDLSVRIQ